MSGFLRACRVVLGAAAAISIAGCSKTNELRQRCLAGDVSACESSCNRGILAEGGCRSAGNLHRRAAALDFQSSEFASAIKYLKKACDGGDGDGCLLTAQMIEAPFGPIDLAEPAQPPKLISDSDLAAREKLLARSCSLDDAAGCKRLGDVLIGKQTDRAVRAYSSACASSIEPAACRAARQRQASVTEAFRDGCTRNDADDCTRLGNVLYAIDAPRAVRLFVAECELRGVEKLAGGVAAFVRQRADSAARGGLRDEKPVFPPADANRSEIALGVPVIHGPLAFVEVARALADHGADVTKCLSGAPAAPDAKWTVELVVDRTGDVWRTTITGAPLDAAAAECVSRVLDPIQFSGPLADPVSVDIPIAVKSAAPPLAKTH